MRTNPVTSGLVEDFDFGIASSVVVDASNNILSIRGLNGNVMSQATQARQPVYFPSKGTPASMAYANFNNSFLQGPLLTSSVDHTVVAVYANGGSSTSGPFYNGSTTTGWGISDGNAQGLLSNMPAIYYNGVIGLLVEGIQTVNNIWKAVAISQGGGIATYYNGVGQDFTFSVAQGNVWTPIAPSGSSYIGYLTNFSNLTGKVARIIVYNRKLSDTEVKAVLQYASYKYVIKQPIALTWTGDSISSWESQTLGNTFTEQAVLQNMPVDMFVHNNARPGWGCSNYGAQTSSDVLSNITALLANRNPNVINIFGMLIGHNDLGQANITVAQIYAAIVSVYTQVIANTPNCFCIATTPFLSTNETTNAPAMTKYNALTALIRAGWQSYASTLFDTGALSGYQDPTNTAVFFDGTHLATAARADIGGKLAVILNQYIK